MLVSIAIGSGGGIVQAQAYNHMDEDASTGTAGVGLALTGAVGTMSALAIVLIFCPRWWWLGLPGARRKWAPGTFAGLRVVNHS